MGGGPVPTYNNPSKLGSVCGSTISDIVVVAAPSSPALPVCVNTSQGNCGVAEHDGAEHQTTSNTIHTSSPCKSHPVKVMVLPELGEINTTTHDTLLFGSVESTPEHNTHLHPHRRWIPMAHLCLKGSVVLGRKI